MKVIIFFIKSIALLIISSFFLIFLNLVMAYSSVNNNLGNVEFYDRVITSEITEELHEKFLDYIVEDFRENTKNEFEEKEIEIVEKSLAKVFTLNWFQKNLRLYFYDFQEYFVYGELLVANVNLRDEKKAIENSFQEVIVEEFSDLSVDEQLDLQERMIMGLEIPERLTSEDIIENYLPYNWQIQFEKMPSYQQTIMLGIYIGFGLFGLLFFFISGTAGAFRLFGLNMLVAGGLNIGVLYYYGTSFLISYIEKIGFTNNSSAELANIVIRNSLLIPVIYVVVGLLLVIVGQKFSKIAKQIEEEEKESQENENQENDTEVEKIEIVEEEEINNIEKKE